MNISTKELSALLGQKTVRNIRYAAGEALSVEAIEFCDGSLIQLQGDCDGQVTITGYKEPLSADYRDVYPVLRCACGWHGLEPDLAESPRAEGQGGGNFAHCPSCSTPVWKMQIDIL